MAGYVDDHFRVEWPGTVSQSFVLAVKADDRWFAVTFGQGRHYVDDTRMVGDFGLRVTANTVDHDRLRSIATVRLGTVTRHTEQRISVPSRLGAFDVDLDGEWVRSLGGESEQHLVTGLTGSRSLSVEVPDGHRLGDLHELLTFLLGRYRATDYQRWYPFLDWLHGLDRTDPRVVQLDAVLDQALVDGSVNFSVMAPPAQPGDEARVTYRIVGRRGSRNIADSGRRLDALGVRYAVRAAVGSPLDLPVACLDPDGHRVGRYRQLREFLAAEVPLDGGTFVLADGRWFAVSDDYLARLARQLDSIPALGWQRLDPADWYAKDSETT